MLEPYAFLIELVQSWRIGMASISKARSVHVYPFDFQVNLELLTLLLAVLPA